MSPMFRDTSRSRTCSSRHTDLGAVLPTPTSCALPRDSLGTLTVPHSPFCEIWSLDDFCLHLMHQDECEGDQARVSHSCMRFAIPCFLTLAWKADPYVLD
jgi:hypothetical protein